MSGSWKQGPLYWQMVGCVVLMSSTVSKNMTEHVRDHSVDDVKLSIPFT